MIRVIEQAILRNCTKDEVDLILESLCRPNTVTDKWNNYFPQCCFNCTTLNNFKSHSHKVLEPETK